MKVAIYTLGCKVNQYETQAMEQTLRAKGHQVVEFSDEADAYVVNTCSVTAVSDQKSRQVIHRVQKQHPAAVVAVCGCYPQTHPEDVRKLGVDLIAGTGDREGFISLLEEAAAGKKNLEALDKSFERWPVHTEPPDHYTLLSYLVDLYVSQSSALMLLHSAHGYHSC